MPGVCPRCLREVYFAEEKLALGKVWHTFCFSCRNCRKLLDSCTVATHCGELFCRNCCTRLFAPSVQPPLPPPKLDPSSNRRIESRFPATTRAPTSVCDSFSDCYCCCCCCCQEDCSIVEVPSEIRESRLEKHRLRGGGGEEEEEEEEEEPEEFRLAEETRRGSESECSNLGVVSSATTLCNVAPSSPTAVTTWYNRQHSASQSTFGGQSCAKSHLGQRPSNITGSANTIKHFPSNKSDCSNIGTANYANGGRKYSAGRTVGGSGRSCLKQHHQPPSSQQQQQQQQKQIHQQEQREVKPQRQQQIAQLRLEQTEQLSEPQKQKQQISEPVEEQKNLQLELHHQELKQQIENNNCCRDDDGDKNESNRYPSSLQRFSRTSDVPEETSSCVSGPINDDKKPNSYSSSNGTPYETCYEMDEQNTGSGYSNCGNDTGYGRSSEVQIEEIPDREEEIRLRGGCGGCGGCPSTSGTASCPPRDDCRRETTASCGTPSCDPPCGFRGGCCTPAGCRPLCRKPIRSCCPPCVAEPQGCGGGGCCGGGCRGGCGKPGRLCMPLRPCSAPPCQPQVCRPRGSPCMPPRCCAPTPPCCKPPGVTTRPSCGIGGGASCCRSKSPRRGCCSAPQDDAACGYCGPRLPAGCECLGGGLDCQRCGRKVYQAEMQIASGVPYHNICFSCYCCRKPLEPLTYQENCGEIYCKQCYVRNFGPQGYGYGAGAGVLQTPM